MTGPHSEHLEPPAPAYACTYQSLVELLAAIDRVAPPDEYEHCETPAVFATAVVRRRRGQDIEIYTQTCDAHDRQFHTVPGYQKSVRLRQPR